MSKYRSFLAKQFEREDRRDKRRSWLIKKWAWLKKLLWADTSKTMAVAALLGANWTLWTFLGEFDTLDKLNFIVAVNVISIAWKYLIR